MNNLDLRLSDAEFEFPAALNTNKGKYVLKKLTSLSEIDMNDIVATRWTREDLEEYEYSDIETIKAPDHFEQDMDICVMMYISDDLIYCMSTVTRKACCFTSNGVNKEMVYKDLPWQVYTPAK